VSALETATAEDRLGLVGVLTFLGSGVRGVPVVVEGVGLREMVGQGGDLLGGHYTCSKVGWR
jgi:biotin transporter BioY